MVVQFMTCERKKVCRNRYCHNKCKRRQRFWSNPVLFAGGAQRNSCASVSVGGTAAQNVKSMTGEKV